jgi:hypothetical protein
MKKQLRKSITCTVFLGIFCISFASTNLFVRHLASPYESRLVISTVGLPNPSVLPKPDPPPEPPPEPKSGY